MLFPRLVFDLLLTGHGLHGYGSGSMLVDLFIR
jgi:hypothetical protein